jgi:RimJ/RimL family protein N-acetyltransferase
MLEFAFEVLKVNRVEQKTDLINLQSQKAMTKLGAFRGRCFSSSPLPGPEGSGFCLFQLYPEEWPSIKEQYFRP